MRIRRILSVDGGGILGIIPAVLLALLERAAKKIDVRFSLWEHFDLVAGSSTGAVIAAAIASGVSGARIRKLYTGPGVRLFSNSANRNWKTVRPWKGKYRRAAFVDEFGKHLCRGRLRDLKTRFMCTAVSLVDGRTHYFKSDDHRLKIPGGKLPDSEQSVMKVVAASGLSAPLFFEPLDDQESGHVWIDGGSGTQNCPFEECVHEAIRRGWYKDQVRILSLGTGWNSVTRTYAEAAKRQSWKSISDFVTLARNNSIPNQFDRWKNSWQKLLKGNVSIARLDVEVPKEQNSLDGWQFAKQYEAYGEKIAATSLKKILRFLEV